MMASEEVKDFEDDLPEHVICPICFNLIVAEAYQCTNGHILCHICYFTMENCPQCKFQLNKETPIRNRVVEELSRPFHKVRCGFETSGCLQDIPRALLGDHQAGCHFNFEKFGQLFNLCNLLGYKCSFLLNNGNTEEAVTHFQRTHYISTTEQATFELELNNFKSIVSTSESAYNNYYVWKPVIAKLQKFKCFLLTTAVYSKQKRIVTFVSVRLPYSISLVNFALQEPLKVTFTAADSNEVESIKTSITLLTIPLSNDIASVFPKKLPLPVGIPILSPFVKKDGNLVVQVRCGLLQAQADVNGLEVITQKEPLAQTKGLTARKNSRLLNREVLFGNVSLAQIKKKVCLKLEEYRKLWKPTLWTLLAILVSAMIWKCKQDYTVEQCGSPSWNQSFISYWDSSQGSDEARLFFQQQLDNCRINNSNVGPFLDEVFAKKFSMWDSEEDLQWLRNGSIFVASLYGTRDEVDLIVEEGVSKNLTDKTGYNTWKLAMIDFNHTRGSRKLSYFNASEDIFLQRESTSLLHVATKWGDLDMVKYYFEESPKTINDLDPFGNTPLHLVMQNVNEEATLEIVPFLLGNGANCKIEDSNGKTSFEIAKTYRSKLFCLKIKSKFRKFWPHCL